VPALQAQLSIANATLWQAFPNLDKGFSLSGSYFHETDFYDPVWHQSLWGDNYARLYHIKQQYDPKGLFICHHCVGSEDATVAHVVVKKGENTGRFFKMKRKCRMKLLITKNEI